MNWFNDFVIMVGLATILYNVSKVFWKLPIWINKYAKYYYNRKKEGGIGTVGSDDGK